MRNLAPCLVFALAIVVASLSQAYAQDDEGMLAKGKYEQGLASKEKGDLEESYAHFLGAFRLDPENPDILMQLGLAAKATKRYEDALLAFENLLELQPSADPARLEMGRVYLALGQREMAEGLFADILSRKPPEQIKVVIASELGMLPSPPQPPATGQQATKPPEHKKFRGFVGGGFAFDTNPRSNPGGRYLDTIIGRFTLPEETTPRFDSNMFELGAFELNLPIQQSPWFSKSTLVSYNTQYRREHDLNLSFIGVSSGFGRMTKRTLWEITPLFDVAWRDNRRLLWSPGVSAEFKALLPGEVLFGLYGRIEDRHFDPTWDYSVGQSVDNSDKNGFRNMVRASLAKKIGRNRFQLQAAQEGQNADDLLRPNAYDQTTLFFQYVRELPFGLEAGAATRFVWFVNRSEDALYARTRRDNMTEFSVSLAKLIDKHWLLSVDASWAYNRSNIQLYEYHRRMARFTAGYVF